MKKLISLLSGVSLTVAPVANSSLFAINQNIKINNKFDLDVSMEHFNQHTKTVKDIIGGKVKDVKIILDAASKMIYMPYYTFDRESNSKYAGMVEEFIPIANSIVSKSPESEDSVKLSEYIKEFRETQTDWSYQFDINNKKRFENLTLQLENDKESARDVYYAYNQLNAYNMSEDMKIYQPIREDLAKWNQEKINTEATLGGLDQYFEKYANMAYWQAKVKGIFTNIADDLQHKLDNFNQMYDQMLGSPENFAKLVASKWKDIGIFAIEKFLGSMGREEEEGVIEDYKSHFKEYSKEIAQGAPAIPDWIKTDDGKEMDIETLKNKAIDEIQKQIDEQKPESRAGILSIVTNVLDVVFSLNQILFGQLFEQSNSLHEYVTTTLPQNLPAIQEVFNEYGMQWKSADQERFEGIMSDIGSTFMDWATMLDPTGIADAVDTIVFGTVENITDWVTALNVKNGEIDKVIAILNDLGDKLSTPDPEIVDKFDENEKLLEDKLAYQKEIDKNITEDEKCLEGSHLKEIQDDIKAWNNLFDKYSDFLDIETFSQSRSITIDYKGYFERGYNDYLKDSVFSVFTYKLMYNAANNGDNSISDKEFEMVFGDIDKLNTLNNSITSYLKNKGGNE